MINLKLYFKQLILNVSMLLICSFFLYSCAKQGYPSGGPVDKQPPIVKGVNPKTESTNFNAKRFRIDFDEYVTMKDADNNVLISPPMANKPEYSTKGHSLIVKLSDTLAPNTTYLFQFKNAIVDFNEGNPLPSFEYVFSTGNMLDSMTISGSVADALTQKASDATLAVVAYEMNPDNLNWGDSIVGKISPTYQTRTASDGSFQFNYIRPGKYKIIALDDADKNLRYSVSEAIAWLDSPVEARLMPKRETIDTTNNTTLADVPTDTVIYGQPSDSIKHLAKHAISLSLSKKETCQQRVLNKEFTNRGHIRIITQTPMLNPVIECDSVIWSLSAKGDTMNVWTLRQTRDSVHIILSDTATSLCDTIILKFREPKKSKRITENTDKNLNKTESLVTASHPYFDTMCIRFETPVTVCNKDSLTLMLLDDSTTIYAKIMLARNTYSIFQHTSSTLAYILPTTSLKQGGKYVFTISPKICRDIYNRFNDSVTVTTTITRAEDYGSLTVDLIPPSDTVQDDLINHAIIQLLSDNDIVVRQLPINQNGQSGNTVKLTFKNLKPSSYRIRLFYDLNGDGRWTPGDYYMHRQPEPVVYFPKKLQLRANWEMNETWNL